MGALGEEGEEVGEGGRGERGLRDDVRREARVFTGRADAHSNDGFVQSERARVEERKALFRILRDRANGYSE